MAELTTTKLNAEAHLLLDQPLLRMPYELCRKNFKTAQRYVDKDTKDVREQLKASVGSPDPLASLDSMLGKMQSLKRKLEALHEDEKTIHKNARARLRHLQDLYEIPSLADVKYDEWSRVRLNRLLVDYLLRMGYGESAKELAREKSIEELVDVDAFVACHRIEASLRNGETGPCLNWCRDNKQALSKMNNNLEFNLRFQQYIELVRCGTTKKLIEARDFAQKHFLQHQDTALITRAAGLLAFPADTEAEPYKSLYSQDRWEQLSNLFLRTHHTLFSLPPRPLLHIALSAGLSALKTPSCHSAFTSPSTNASSTSTSVCPICSTELNELARNVPYAHHTKSYVENDPVVLPNGRIYGSERLRVINEKLGTPRGRVKDLMDFHEEFDEKDVKKVFIS